MPLVAPVSYRSWPVRIGMGLLYFFLILGGITMVYPFALMVSTSITSEQDSDELRLVPRFLYDDVALYQKYLSTKYGLFVGKWGTVASPVLLNRSYDSEEVIYQFQEVLPPDLGAYTPEQMKSIETDYLAYREYIGENYPAYLYTFFRGRPSQIPAWTILGEAVEDYRDWIEEKFDGDVAALNAAYNESLPEDETIRLIMPQVQNPWSPSWLPVYGDPQYEDWQQWQTQTEPRFADVLPLVPMWHRYIESHPDFQRAAAEGRLIQAINERWDTDYARLVNIPLPAEPPANPAMRDYWSDFVRDSISRHYLRFEEGIAPLYREALREEYLDIATLNRLTGNNYASFEDIPVPERVVEVSGPLRSVFLKLVGRKTITEESPFNYVQVVVPENLYGQFLIDRYGSLAAVNQAYGWNLSNVQDFRIPRPLLDWRELERVEGQYKSWMIFRNYRMVWSFIVGHGRALWNTFVLCMGAIFFTLTVNPLCAYALSRYGLKHTNKILIYLLATMAFPPSVAMIPSFLLLRDLHLLNTYWALLLPSAANGFTVFMMKGFFDTLPREVFEAAKIDGASEGRMFFQILIPLCKPVFGFFALGAFTSAYSGFIWAFTICPKEEMWTMMVWLYQLTSLQPAGVQMAALVVAAIPTLLVFTVVQNIILKGIVLPSFH